MIIQGQPETHWFSTNAPAAWFAATVSFFSLLYVLRSRKKPKKLVVREVRNSSLINIWPGVRPKIKMTFCDKPIGTLGQVDGDIFNEGSGTIQNPTFTLTLPSESRVLDILITPDDFGAKPTLEGEKLTLALPYLNSVREHGEVLKLSVLVDGKTEPIKISGGGEGWSVRYRALVNPRRQRLVNAIVLGVPVVMVPLGLAYTRYVQKHLGIDIGPLNGKTVKYLWPFLLAILLYSVFVVRDLRSTVRLGLPRTPKSSA